MYYQLKNVIVNAPEVGCLIKLFVYNDEGGYVVAKGLRDAKLLIRIDLNSGLITTASALEGGGWHSIERDQIDNFSDEDKFEVDTSGYTPQVRLVTWPPDEIVIQLIKTLVLHRVSGEDIQKALRTKGLNPDCKIESNYLGGWNVIVKGTDGQSRGGVSHLIDWIIEQTE
jgi:hypothetical protein